MVCERGPESRIASDNTRAAIRKMNNQPASSAGASSGPSQGCGANGPSFDLVVFFQPVANAGPQGVTSVTGVSSSTSSTGGTQ